MDTFESIDRESQRYRTRVPELIAQYGHVPTCTTDVRLVMDRVGKSYWLSLVKRSIGDICQYDILSATTPDSPLTPTQVLLRIIAPAEIRDVHRLVRIFEHAKGKLQVPIPQGYWYEVISD